MIVPIKPLLKRGNQTICAKYFSEKESWHKTVLRPYEILPRVL